MVDAQSVDVATHEQLEQQAMALGEDRRVFHANGRQFVDVEKTAIIDLVGGRLPVRKPIDLGVEQFIEVVVTVWIVDRAAQFPHVAVDELGDCRRAFGQFAQAALDHLFFALSLGDAAGLGFRAQRQVFQRGDDALQFPQFLGLLRQRFLQRVEPVGENHPVGSRIQGQQRPVVAHPKSPLAIFELQVARFKGLAVLVAQDRQQQPVPQFLFHRPPIDVEVGGVRRTGTVFQHIVPPTVFGRGGAHVIGHRVEDLPHRAAVQRVDHRPIIIPAAQLGIQLRVIDDGIAVRTARPRLQTRGSVNVADAQFVEVWRQRRGVAERHLARLELKSVRGRRTAETFLDRPRHVVRKPLGPSRQIAHVRSPALPNTISSYGNIRPPAPSPSGRGLLSVPSPFGRGLG